MKRVSILLLVLLSACVVAGGPGPSFGVSFQHSISNVFARFSMRWPDARAAGERVARGAFRSKRHDAFSAAKAKLAVIVAGGRAGTGFVMREGGRIWLLTNAHLVRGQNPVRATMLDGTTLALGPCEFAVGRDLARFPLDGNRPALEVRPGLPDVGERVTVLGNSDGRGVITELNGRVVGGGPTETERDATSPAGDSGTPALHRNGRVLAVASYLRNCRDDRDWSKTNTRFNGIRRFALRLAGVKWERE